MSCCNIFNVKYKYATIILLIYIQIMYHCISNLNYMSIAIVYVEILMWFQRYYYYIHNGIDTEHVAPMEDLWVEHILQRISEQLKVGLNDTLKTIDKRLQTKTACAIKLWMCTR